MKMERTMNSNNEMQMEKDALCFFEEAYQTFQAAEQAIGGERLSVITSSLAI